MKAENNLVTFFKAEHAALLERFEKQFLLAQNSHDWKLLYLICKTEIEENHHAKEEQFIFDAVKDNDKIKSGGPQCTYFFDFHLTNPTLRRAIEASRKITGITFEPEWSPQMKIIRDHNLPIVIPGEDHEAGRIVLRGVEKLLAQVNTDRNQKNIETLFNVYIEIQKEHFDREENCFFVMCNQLISSDKWEKIYVKMCSQYPIISNANLNIN